MTVKNFFPKKRVILTGICWISPLGVTICWMICTFPVGFWEIVCAPDCKIIGVWLDSAVPAVELFCKYPNQLVVQLNKGNFPQTCSTVLTWTVCTWGCTIWIVPGVWATVAVLVVVVVGLELFCWRLAWCCCAKWK